MSNMLCLYMMVRVGMHKTEYRFWIRSQVMYSDDFYPILFYILKCWLQPTKLVSSHNQPMTLQLEKQQLFDSRSYLYTVPFAWTTPSPLFTHFNLSSKITSSKKPSWTTPYPITTTTTTKIKQNLLWDALESLMFFITALIQVQVDGSCLPI